MKESDLQYFENKIKNNETIEINGIKFFVRRLVLCGEFPNTHRVELELYSK